MSCDDSPGRYRVEEAQRQDLLRILQNQFADLYHITYRRAVTYTVDRLQSAEADQRQTYENLLMSLLDTLFRRYMSIHEVLELTLVLASAAAAPLDNLNIATCSHTTGRAQKTSAEIMTRRSLSSPRCWRNLGCTINCALALSRPSASTSTTATNTTRPSMLTDRAEKPMFAWVIVWARRRP